MATTTTSTTTSTACSVSLPKQCKPSRAVSNGEKHTPVLGYVNLRKTRAGVELQASDRFIAVRIPLKVHGSRAVLVEGPIPTRAMQELEKGSAEPVRFAATAETVKVGDGITHARPQSGKFPDLTQVQPSKPTKPVLVALDTVLLRKLASALGSAAVVLEFDGASMGDRHGYLRPIAVRSANPVNAVSGAHGLIMPIRVAV